MSKQFKKLAKGQRKRHIMFRRLRKQARGKVWGAVLQTAK